MMPTLKATEIAKTAMGKGFNCCEAMLLTAKEVWGLQLPEETFAAAALFTEGMGGGCCCGALVGLMMISGILSKEYSHPKGRDLAPYLHDTFKERFGSTCCRVICSRRKPLERIGKRGCKELTGVTAQLMVEVWDDVILGKKQDIRDHTDAQ
jgi:C_GCAxxG_C_C family probable redox protein